MINQQTGISEAVFSGSGRRLTLFLETESEPERDVGDHHWFECRASVEAPAEDFHGAAVGGLLTSEVTDLVVALQALLRRGEGVELFVAMERWLSLSVQLHRHGQAAIVATVGGQAAEDIQIRVRVEADLATLGDFVARLAVLREADIAPVT